MNGNRSGAPRPAPEWAAVSSAARRKHLLVEFYAQLPETSNVKTVRSSSHSAYERAGKLAADRASISGFLNGIRRLALRHCHVANLVDRGLSKHGSSLSITQSVKQSRIVRLCAEDRSMDSTMFPPLSQKLWTETGPPFHGCYSQRSALRFSPHDIQHFPDFGDQFVAAIRLRKSIERLDVILDSYPVILQKPSHNQNRQSVLLAAQIIGCRPPWHAVDERTSDQQIGPHLGEAVDGFAEIARRYNQIAGALERVAKPCSHHRFRIQQ